MIKNNKETSEKLVVKAGGKVIFHQSCIKRYVEQ